MLKSFGKYWQNFAEFAPRTRRRDFWFAFLANMIINCVLSAATFFVPFFKYILIAYTIVCLCPGLAITFRRLHDTGKKGTFIFINLIPVVGSIIFLVKLAKDSDAEENKYGISEKYAAPEEINEAVAQEPAPMYIPPIYSTDKLEQPPVEEEAFSQPEKAEEPVKTEKPVPVQPAEAEQVQTVREDKFRVEQTSEADNEFNAYQPVTAPQAVSAEEKAASDETAAFAKAPESSLNEQQYTASRPVYSTAPVKKAAEEPVQRPERPKGYRSRTFPYGH